MSEQGHRISQRIYGTHGILPEKTPEARRAVIEYWAIIITMFLTAISGVVTAYSAIKTADQAEYAREALTASERNSAFLKYLETWDSFCASLRPEKTEMSFRYRRTNDAMAIRLPYMFFDFMAMGEKIYMSNIADSRIKLFAELDTLGLFLNDSEYSTLKEPLLNSVLFFKVPLKRPISVPELKAWIVKDMAVCSDLVTQQRQWYRHRSGKIVLVDSQQITVDQLQ